VPARQAGQERIATQILTSVCRVRAYMEVATTESTNTCALASQDTLAPTARLKSTSVPQVLANMANVKTK
jgi:hypothetical protein